MAGNPNSGKTTMYNALTGQNERVGNWAGGNGGTKRKAVSRRCTAAVLRSWLR